MSDTETDPSVIRVLPSDVLRVLSLNFGEEINDFYRGSHITRDTYNKLCALQRYMMNTVQELLDFEATTYQERKALLEQDEEIRAEMAKEMALSKSRAK